MDNNNFGIISYEGRMYNLDEMKADEIKELMKKMKKYCNDLEIEVKTMIGIYN